MLKKNSKQNTFMFLKDYAAFDSGSISNILTKISKTLQQAVVNCDFIQLYELYNAIKVFFNIYNIITLRYAAIQGLIMKSALFYWNYNGLAKDCSNTYFK
jgi:hypothetical protein